MTTMFDELIYRDGSANSYHFRSDGDGDGARFEYRPVTPLQSSTGMYSGGEPRAGRLDATQLATLWQHVSAFETNAALHTEDRAKGTGLFVITTAGIDRSFIIVRGVQLLAFDAFLGELR